VTDEIIIVTPELSTGAGGVSDYTQRLIGSWPGKESLRVLVPGNADGELPSSGGKVLVQYSAYGFDHHGYPKKLIRALADWKMKTGGRLVVMFHEIWTFWPVTNKNFLVQRLHRRAIKKLIGVADKVFTSTQSQVEHLRKLSSRNPVGFLPVGSNIPRNEDVDVARNPGCAVIFGLQRARVRDLRKMRVSLGSLTSAGLITKIISIGAGNDPTLEAEERSLLGDLQLKESFEQRGPLPEREVSELLLRAAFGIFAQDELSLTKSGTFMAFAAHELNVIAQFADKSKPAPTCWVIAPQELLTGISNAELKARAENLRAWQYESSSWDLIAGTFAEALESNALKPSRSGAIQL
jgi:hypothetical protein